MNINSNAAIPLNDHEGPKPYPALQLCEAVPCESRRKSLRFDIFKGVPDDEGRIKKTKTVGVAYLQEGSETYTVFLKTFLKDTFYLLPETRDRSRGDFGIRTRAPSPSPSRRFIWNNVGEGRFLVGLNKGLVHLVWDLFGDQNLYMSMEPKPESHNEPH